MASLPDRCPFAVWTPYSRWPTGNYSDNVNYKVCWHTTQGGDGVLNWYNTSGGIPKFTVLTTGVVHQHYSMNKHDRGLRNLPGGVQTNLDGAISVEIVGFAGHNHTADQRTALTTLTAWFTEIGIPAVWLNGAPVANHVPRRLSASAWDNGSGHCGHIDVPENDHRDPGFTASTLAAVEAGFAGGDEMIPHDEWRQAYNAATTDATDPIVVEVQRFLAGYGLYGGDFDGLKGGNTDLGWVAWEVSIGVTTPNARAGAKSWAAYEDAKYTPCPPTSDDDLEECQTRLADCAQLLATCNAERGDAQEAHALMRTAASEAEQILSTALGS